MSSLMSLTITNSLRIDGVTMAVRILSVLFAINSITLIAMQMSKVSKMEKTRRKCLVVLDKSFVNFIVFYSVNLCTVVKRRTNTICAHFRYHMGSIIRLQVTTPPPAVKFH